MEVSKVEFESIDSKKVPTFSIDAKSPKAALVIHGCSSSKNYMLGFGYEVAEKGYDVYVIDLRGHGENENLFDGAIINDVEGVSKELREKYNYILIGHSLSGLLSLKSSSDFVIAISPPLMPNVVDAAKFMLRLILAKLMRKTRMFYSILENYNLPKRKDNVLIIYGLGESRGIEIGKKWVEGMNVLVAIETS